MNTWHLIWIIPISFLFGCVITSVMFVCGYGVSADDDDDYDYDDVK